MVEGLTRHELVLRDMEAHIHIHVTDTTAATVINDQCSTNDRGIGPQGISKPQEAKLQ